MAIFSNHLISISSNPSSILLNLFLSLNNHNTRLSFSISPFLSHSNPHLSTSIFFYLFVNLNSRLSSSISAFLSHFILHLSSSIYPLSIHVNLFLSLSESQYAPIFFNLHFSISFHPSTIIVNLFLSSCKSSRCLSLSITNKIAFYLSLSLLTTKKDLSTIKIFYILFL